MIQKNEEKPLTNTSSLSYQQNLAGAAAAANILLFNDFALLEHLVNKISDVTDAIYQRKHE